MEKLTLNKLIIHLGQPRKKIGNEYVWQCPYCKDRGKDNLKFNENKGVLFCFANNKHSRAILSDLFKNSNYSCTQGYKKPLEPIVNGQNNIIDVYSIEIQKKLMTNLIKWNYALLNDEKALKILYKKRGLTKETVELCGIGIDKQKHLWTIPTFKYDCDNTYIIGFEYRQADLSKTGLHRTKNTPNAMAMTNCYAPQVEALVIVEGYFDGYALYQHLNALGQAPYYHIATPSNGVNSLLKYMPQIDFSRYQKCYLYIDNDKPSQRISADIIEKYPYLEVINMTCGCKDFNEHYLKCLKLLKI